MEQEAGKIKVATQTQLLVQKEAETERKRAVSEAEKREIRGEYEHKFDAIRSQLMEALQKSAMLQGRVESMENALPPNVMENMEQRDGR